jgi:hypothetical protein
LTERTDWPSLEEVKDQLRITHADHLDDSLVEAARDAAVAYVENRTGRAWGDAESGVPPDLRLGTVMLAARLFKRRDSVDGTVGFADVGIIRLGARDSDIERLLVPYLKIPVA